MFRALSAHPQEDTIVYMQPMVLSLCMRVPGGLSVHSLSEKPIEICGLRWLRYEPFSAPFKDEPSQPSQSSNWERRLERSASRRPPVC